MCEPIISIAHELFRCNSCIFNTAAKQIQLLCCSNGDNLKHWLPAFKASQQKGTASFSARINFSRSAATKSSQSKQPSFQCWLVPKRLSASDYSRSSDSTFLGWSEWSQVEACGLKLMLGKSTSLSQNLLLCFRHSMGIPVGVWSDE